ncbi:MULTISPECIES: STAS domain-containing protein [unclassified Nonomuraea]|uniref:STAS domain-containing protein n=1 Tax=unclassified Nonomuraea TaxID=2593643 RepID=UPI0033D68DE8
MTPLSMSCRDLPGGVLVTVIGELDSSNSPRLESFTERHLRPGAGMVLDLGGLTFMDSRGLHVLLRLDAAVLEGGGVLRLAGVQELPARVLQVTGVWSSLTVHAQVDDAVAAMGARRPDSLRESS